MPFICTRVSMIQKTKRQFQHNEIRGHVLRFQGNRKWHEKMSACDWKAAKRRSDGSVFTESNFEKLLYLTN